MSDQNKDANGLEIHTFLMLPRPGSTKCGYVPHSERDKLMYLPATNIFRALEDLNLVDLSALCQQHQLPVTLEYCNMLCYMLDKLITGNQTRN